MCEKIVDSVVKVFTLINSYIWLESHQLVNFFYCISY